MAKDLIKKNLLITGGTGTLGKGIVKYLIDNHLEEYHRIIIYSRDEQKQFQMENDFPISKYPQLRFFIGDVRDYPRLKMAMQGVDFVIHAAAMKHVPIAEYNPMECIKTNIIGAENVINACLETGVKKVVALSTDKACSPVNLYGATKLVSDKLFVAANNITGANKITFSVVRYGNVMGSNGSVIPFFNSKLKEGVLPITHPEMTRFNIEISKCVKMVMGAFDSAWGGEIFVPKLPSFKVIDLANAMCDNCEKNIIGIRPGEKIHEEMINASDSFYTYDIGDYYVILPTMPKWDLKQYIDAKNAKKVDNGFEYNSGKNSEWESTESLKSLIKSYV
jgi:UDP-N-acetylglucosamine 4,6-dehydratase (inverting)